MEEQRATSSSWPWMAPLGCASLTHTLTHVHTPADPLRRWAVWTPPGGRGAQLLVLLCKETLNKCLPSNVTALTKSKYSRFTTQERTELQTAPPTHPLTSHVDITAAASLKCKAPISLTVFPKTVLGPNDDQKQYGSRKCTTIIRRNLSDFHMFRWQKDTGDFFQV